MLGVGQEPTLPSAPAGSQNGSSRGVGRCIEDESKRRWVAPSPIRLTQAAGGGGTFVGSALLASSLILMSSGAGAQSCPFAPPSTISLENFPTTCEFLPRSPLMLDPNLTARCDMDQDGNGLDDEIEAQIAHCFVPEFRFDKDEPSDSLRPCEPILGYSAYRIAAAQDDEILIRYRFVVMFRRDGGFVADDSFWCGDDHDGDTQQFNFDVRVSDTDVWRASLARFDTCAQPTMAGTHPVLYPTAGKHHLECVAGTSVAFVDFPSGDRPCLDPHRGNGPIRLPSFLFKVAPSRVFINSTSTGNVCEFVRSGAVAPAPGLQPPSLANLGFPGQFVGTSFFDADSVWSVVKPDGAFTFDADGDGKSEMSFVDVDFIEARPEDACGLDKIATAADDLDADGLTGKCDPHLSFRQKYVGIGEPGFPPVPPPEPNWENPVHGLGGFWDQDQDRGANGFDGCPTLVTSSQGISNHWAENVNWPPDPVNNNDFGFFQRGDACDPYPVSHTKWRTLFQRSTKCGPPRFVARGTDYVLTRTAAARGASANDPYWDTAQPEAAKTWAGNAYRCACRSVLTGAPLTGSACVADPASECFRDNVAEAVRQTYSGRGWRALDRSGCSRTDTWCNPSVLPVPRFDVGHSKSHWAWTQESTLFPAGSPTQHYSPGDLVSFPGSIFNGAHTRTVYEYAVWSLVELDDHLGLPKRASAPFPDPEFDPLNRALALRNVNSQVSRLVRSSLSEQTAASLTSAHDSLTVGITCGLLTLQQQLAKVELWFGPDPVSPVRSDFSRVRGVVHDDAGLLTMAVLRPAEGNYMTPQLGVVAMDSWLSSSSVSISPLQSNRGFSGPLPGLTLAAAAERDINAEPDLFVFERGVSDRPARFARLAPVEVSDTTIRYEAARFGELRGTLSSAAQAVTDAEGRVAAVVDLATGFVEAVLPDGERPMRHALPPELLYRSEAALRLRGNLLLVAGGVNVDGALESDLWLVDLYSGTTAKLRSDLPARRGAQLSVTPNGSHVLYAGGTDAMGESHDDVWQLASYAAVPGVAAPTRMFADTSAASAGLAQSALAFDPIAAELTRLDFDPALPEALALSERTTHGWQPLDDTGQLMTCQPEDPVGGQLCRLDKSWWSGTGRIPCGGGTCSGAAGELLHETKLLPPIVAADVSDGALWLARPHRVEYRAASEAGSLAAPLGQGLQHKALDIAARGTTALVATRGGVRLASLATGGVSLSPELKLCGAPYDVEALGDDSWAVMTPLGLAIVGGGLDSELRVHSMSLLVPLGPHGKLIPLHVDPSKVWACKLANKFGHFAGFLKGVTAVAAVDGGRVLVANGKHLFDVDTSNSAEPELRGVTHLKKPLSALRADATGGRAYGVGAPPKHRPVFDLRGATVAPNGNHNIRAWVTRRDSGNLRLRRHGAWAQLAWVSP